MSVKSSLSIQALRYTRHGLPSDVLEESALDVPPLKKGEAMVALRAAGIHYSDLGLINGTYGRLRALPAVAGREGVGEVVALGPETSGPSLGSLVKMPEDAGVWCEAVVADAAALFPIPPKVPLEQAALAFINPPTAWRMLHDFVQLQPGDWLIQNAGTSAVGELVTQMARHLGLRVISVVRDVAKSSARLREAGAAVVVAEDSGYEKNPAASTGGASIKLALNAIGGESVGRLCRAVAPGGVVVTYGGVTSDPMRFPTRFLIFNNIALRGYWNDEWAHTHPAAEVQALWNDMFRLIQDGVILQPVAALYPLAQWRAALDHAFQPGRTGKVLFTSNWRL